MLFSWICIFTVHFLPHYHTKTNCDCTKRYCRNLFFFLSTIVMILKIYIQNVNVYCCSSEVTNKLLRIYSFILFLDFCGVRKFLTHCVKNMRNSPIIKKYIILKIWDKKYIRITEIIHDALVIYIFKHNGTIYS